MKLFGLVAAAVATIAGAAQADDSWDYFLFVKQWTESTCLTSSRTCNIPSGVNTFTIHGLWPNRNDGSYPANCGGEFDPSKISDLESQLATEWPDVFSSGDQFHEHEYDKHGTCCKDLPATATEHDYFATALNLTDHMPLLDYLKAAQIYPDSSTTYSASAIEDALESAIQHNVLVQCKGSSVGTVITQIGVCYDKSLAIMDCPSSLSGMCNSDSVKIPPLEHNQAFAANKIIPQK